LRFESQTYEKVWLFLDTALSYFSGTIKPAVIVAVFEMFIYHMVESGRRFAFAVLWLIPES